MKKFIIVCLFCFVQQAFAQEPYRNIFSIGNCIYSIEAIKQVNGPIKVTVFSGDSKNDSGVPFFFYRESVDVFRKSFSSTITKLAKKVKPADSTCDKKDDVKNIYADEIYRDLLLYELSPKEVVPAAGYLILNRDVNVEPCETIKIPCKKDKRIAKLQGIIDTLLFRIDQMIINLEILKQNKIVDSKQINFIQDDCIRVLDIKKKLYDTENETTGQKLSRKDLKNEIIACQNKSSNYRRQIVKSNEWISKIELINKIENSNARTRVSLDSILTPAIRKLAEAFKGFNIINKFGNPFYSISKRKFFTVYDRIEKMAEQLEAWNLQPPDQKIKQVREIIDSVLQFNAHYQSLKSMLTCSLDSADESIKSNYSQCEEVRLLIGYFNKELLVQTNTPTTTASEKKVRKKVIVDLNQRIVDETKNLDILKLKSVELSEFRFEIDSTQRDFNNRLSVPILTFRKMISQYQELDNTIKENENRRDDLKKSLKYLLDPKLYRVDTAHLEFNDGVLKNIVVEGKFQNKMLFFTNTKPIQFTSITHIEKLKKVDLVDMSHQDYRLNLVEVLQYIPVLQVDAEDYSPCDSVYNLQLKNDDTIRFFKAEKEKISRILDARIYTDLVGFGADQPNGLIQFEISKKIPMFTHRIKYCKNYRSFVSFGSWYEPKFTLSKLEQNHKFYYLPQYDTIFNKGTISTIDVYKYSSMRLGVLYINLFNWEIAEVKSALELNAGFSFLYTPVRDTLSVKESMSQWGAISGLPYGEVKFIIKPDARYGFSVSASFGWLLLWDSKLRMINDPANPTLSKSYNKDLLTFQFDTFFKPFLHAESAIFFRVANVHTFPMKLNYLQVQIGYAFNIFKKSGGK